MLNVYKVISENVSVAIATNGENVTKQPLIKSMRTVKKETLKLISSWVGHSTDPQMVCFDLIFFYLSSCLFSNGLMYMSGCCRRNAVVSLLSKKPVSVKHDFKLSLLWVLFHIQ